MSWKIIYHLRRQKLAKNQFYLEVFSLKRVEEFQPGSCQNLTGIQRYKSTKMQSTKIHWGLQSAVSSHEDGSHIFKMLLLCFYEGLILLLLLVVSTTLNEKIRDKYKSMDYQFSSSVFLPPRHQLRGYCETFVWILFSRGNWSLQAFQQVFKLWFSLPHIWRKPFTSCKERQVVTESEAAVASQKPFLVFLFSSSM